MVCIIAAFSPHWENGTDYSVTYSFYLASYYCDDPDKIYSHRMSSSHHTIEYKAICEKNVVAISVLTWKCVHNLLSGKSHISEVKTGTQPDACTPVLINNNQEMETTPMSSNRWIDKQNVVYT